MSLLAVFNGLPSQTKDAKLKTLQAIQDLQSFCFHEKLFSVATEADLPSFAQWIASLFHQYNHREEAVKLTALKHLQAFMALYKSFLTAQATPAERQRVLSSQGSLFPALVDDLVRTCENHSDDVRNAGAETLLVVAEDFLPEDNYLGGEERELVRLSKEYLYLGFNKSKSEGVREYSERHNEALAWLFSKATEFFNRVVTLAIDEKVGAVRERLHELVETVHFKVPVLGLNDYRIAVAGNMLRRSDYLKSFVNR